MMVYTVMVDMHINTRIVIWALRSCNTSMHAHCGDLHWRIYHDIKSVETHISLSESIIELYV